MNANDLVAILNDQTLPDAAKPHGWTGGHLARAADGEVELFDGSDWGSPIPVATLTTDFDASLTAWITGKGGVIDEPPASPPFATVVRVVTPSTSEYTCPCHERLQGLIAAGVNVYDELGA